MSLLKECIFFTKRISFDPHNENIDKINMAAGLEGIEKRKHILHKLYDLNKLS